MFEKIAYIIAKQLHRIIPNYILMNMLRLACLLPLIRKFVRFFDPNGIRKFTTFDLNEKKILLRNKKWSLLLNSRDHIGFVSYLRNEPFEMAIYNVANRLASSKRQVIIDLGANIGCASIPICAENGYELLAVEASKQR